MAFPKLLMNIVIIANMSLIIYGINSTEYQKQVITLWHYNIMIQANIQNSTFNAEVTASIKIENTIQSLNLKVAWLNIKNISLINIETSLHHETNQVNQHHDIGVITLHFKYALHPGIYHLIIYSKVFLNNEVVGLHNLDSSGFNSTWFFATVFPPVGTPESKLCWYKPMLKASFNISVKHPASYFALSNTRTRLVKKIENDNVITLFHTTPMIFPHSIVVMISKIANDVRKEESSTFVVWCRSHLLPYVKYTKEIAEKVNKKLEWYTNNTRNISYTNLVVLPGKFKVIQKWGFIIYSEKYFIYNEMLEPPDHKIDVAIVTARGLVYQWLGDVIDQSWCNNTWFNEALVSFFQMYTLDKIFEKWRIMDLFVVRYLQPAFRTKIDFNMDPMIDETSENKTIKIDNNSLIVPFSANYSKAPFLIRMLQHITSEEVFRKGIITFLNKFQSSSATPDDFWATMQKVLDESSDLHVFKLKEIMESWLKEENYPVLNVLQNYMKENVYVSQFYFNEQTIRILGKWWIPLTFTVLANFDFSNMATYYLMPPYKSIGLPNTDLNGWIIINIQQVGFYRVLYDNNNWRKIANYLNSDEYTNIHVLNRAQIIDDAFYFVMKRQLKPSIFFHLITYLNQETDYIAWYPMKHILQYLWSFSQLPGTSFITERILPIWDGLLNNVGFTEHPDDDDIMKMKRMFAIEWACKIGNQKCRKMTSVEMAKLMSEPATEITPWKKLIFCAGLIEASMTTWAKVLMRYIKTQEKILLEFLACSENEEIIKLYLEIFLPVTSYNKNVFVAGSNKNLDRGRILHLIIKKHIGKDFILDYILSNFMRLRPREITQLKLLTDIITYVRTEEQLNKIKKFLLSDLMLNLTWHETVLMKQVHDMAERKFYMKEEWDKFMQRFDIAKEI